MMTDVYKRLSYIHQMSLLLKEDDNNLVHNKLVSFYGHLSHEVRLKNQIHSLGCDDIKRLRCKTCYSLLDCSQTRIKDKLVIMKCMNCGRIKRYPFSKSAKTFYEKQLQRNKTTTH